MPARNSLKMYVDDSYYHLYNRGVEKRTIFIDEQDYGVFLGYLKEYLLPKDEETLRKMLGDPSVSYREKDTILKKLRLNNFADEVSLIAYCLMPNHFHFFIKQKSAQTINKFMRSLCTRYTMYFNRKYNRVGSLFQDVYKAVLITHENQFLHLSRYIHKQALSLQGDSLQTQPCSYDEYLGKRKTEWVKPDEVLYYFSKTNPKLSYQTFVSEQDDFEILQDLTLENDF
ncbi:transposase [Candidatus Microgenomates bacterium]|nr:transposase [Candidatus Microgenomates bacterium]